MQAWLQKVTHTSKIHVDSITVLLWSSRNIKLHFFMAIEGLLEGFMQRTTASNNIK